MTNTANDESEPEFVDTTTRHKIPFKRNIKLPTDRYSFQIELMDILQKHKADLQMHDEIVLLLDGYLQNGKINPTKSGLRTRKEFIKQV